MNRNGLLYTVIFTFVVCFVFVSVLALVHEGTLHRVRQNELVAQQGAIVRAMGFSFDSDREILGIFEEVESIERNGRRFFHTRRNGESIYASEFSGQGLWGPIRTVIAMKEGFEEITGLEIIGHEETPGLGGRITEPAFLASFSGLTVDRDAQIRLVANPSPHDATEIQAITGATSTSNSMQRIVNSAIETFRTSFDI